ncbi:carbohydrate esterase family 9 protein [Penicillium alfredii]|uniref:Carbohydrate esterase family 9 protein n=1 Tax=Penicillium alfredii TaxID=1506179 RepID=A0A9W9FU10_9EURO|nr:carbohydrate esterase family 9 protein [Penicillium alfredii]KAJ5106070.1 carbohydrate esterase family 9 protein [Penicillium alfredii]
MAHVVQLTNTRLVDGDQLIAQSLWFDSIKGIFVSHPQHAPASTVDCQNRIVAPGFLDLQINGAYGFDFSEDVARLSEADHDWHDELLADNDQPAAREVPSGMQAMPISFAMNREKEESKAVAGSDYSPQNLPYLGPSRSRRPSEGTESLGAHCEGPFFAHNRMGVHLPAAIHASGSTSEPDRVFQTYGSSNLVDAESKERDAGSIPSHVRMITLAPERPGALDTIRQLSDEGIVMSIGHMAADYQQARAGVDAGATMVTHLYNQMNSHHHREPGPLGVLTDTDAGPEMRILGQGTEDGGVKRRPYFGIIADGSHVHPASLRLAYQAHPDGLVLVTDALLPLGGEDGTVDWGSRQLTKQGVSVKLEGTDTIAGSCVTLLECVNNFRRWTGASIPTAMRAVTSTPAAVLGLEHVKGTFQAGADADFVVLSEEAVPGLSSSELVVDQVWKFGVKVYDRCDV